ncbi:retrovirus-related pol polyprotein from transposon TNT 1-94 [Tanacetum coccineum]
MFCLINSNIIPNKRDGKKGKSDRKYFRCGDPNHLIGDCSKPSCNKDQKAFIGGSWSNSENEAKDKTNDETCLMAQSSNEVTLTSSHYSDNASSLDNDSMQIEYDSLCEISLKIINKNKILKTKRYLLEKEILELNEKIKKLERSKEVEIACKSCEELKSENTKLKETQVKFVKFDKCVNSLREMLNNEKSPSCKIGLGFDSNKASTSGTKTMSFIGSSTEKGTDGSTIKVHGSTLPGSMSRTNGEKGTKHVFSPPISSRLDFVITRKKLIHNTIDESKKPSLNPSPKSGIGYVKTESRPKMPPPKRNISYQPRYNTPQSKRKFRQPIHQNFYLMNWNNQQNQGFVCLRTCLEPDEWIKDSGCSKHMTGNKSLFSTYKAYDGGNVVFGSNLKGKIIGKEKTPYEIFRGRKPSLEYFKVFGSKFFILNTKDYLTKFDPKSHEGVFLGYSQNSKAYVVLNKHTMKVEESFNVTLNESPPPTKLSPLVDDDVGEEEAIRKNIKIVNLNNEEDESLEVNEIINIKESKNHPLDKVIGKLNQRTLRSQAQNHSNDVWELVPLPISQPIIGTKWVFRNKLDENSIVSRNKARLVAQGYNQQERIDYDETYALVARLESIRILIAIVCANDFKLYQMDVKSGFQNGFINEEVYIAQPPGFIDFQKPNYVYKLKKALYDLQQAPKAWYDRLKAFLIKHEYSMGMVDNTLFTKKSKSHLIIVQIYVNDNIFGSTSQNLCDDFAKIMHDEFEMSMIGELNFFLGLQIKQMEDRIFFNQSKYIKEMLKKFGLEDSKPTKTPMSTEIKLTKDDEADFVDSSKYRGMIGSLLYLTASRPDIMFSVFLCACFQENLKTTHLEAVKRIFMYIRGTSHLGLWYPKGTEIETAVYADSDHAGDYVDRKRTSGACTFMGCCLTSWFAKKQMALAISTTETEYVSVRKACQQALWMK